MSGGDGSCPFFQQVPSLAQWNPDGQRLPAAQINRPLGTFGE